MKRAALVLWCLMTLGVSCLGGMYLARFLLSVPFDVPLWLEELVRYGFHVAYHVDTPDVGDLEDGVALLLILASYIVVTMVVLLVSVFAWRRLSVRWFLGR
jgi:hypothetical protein